MVEALPFTLNAFPLHSRRPDEVKERPEICGQSKTRGTASHQGLCLPSRLGHRDCFGHRFPGDVFPNVTTVSVPLFVPKHHHLQLKKCVRWCGQQIEKI